MSGIEQRAGEPQNYTILIVDDNPANLAVVVDHLVNYGFLIQVARTGEAGLELAQQDQPDLILLDVMLPGIDGFEVCRRLQADERTREVPVIFMTVLTRVEDKVKGFEAGGVDYVSKPFQEQEILARVTTHLRLRELTGHLEHQVRERTRELSKANQAYKALSDCNQALMRATEEGELLQEVCRIILEDCGYQLVWIGFAEHDQAKTVRPVAQAGYERGYLDTINVTWADTELGHGPTGTAIRTQRPVINRDVLTHPDFAPWRAEAIERGYTSSAAFPLLTSEREAIGALNVYTAEPDAFTTEQVKLLMELTADLTFGIVSLRVRAERERAKEALAQSESKLRSILQSMDDPVFVLDRETRFTDCYAPDQELYALPEAFIGRKHAEVMPPEMNEPFTKAFNENREGRAAEFEYQLEIGGEIRWYAAKLSPMLLEGEFAGSVAVIRDITARKQAEDELRKHRDYLDELVQERTTELVVAKEQALEARRIAESNAQAAEAANRAKSAFLANMSHELRTPLNAILGYAQILQRRPLAPDVIDGLDIVQRSGEHLLTLITDILDLSRIEAGRMALHPVPIHFPNFLDHIASIIRARAEAKGLVFSFDHPPEGLLASSSAGGLPTWVQADETRLRQVLLNLLDNAVKFTDEGQVILRVRCEDVKRESRITFEVQDTGIGIPSDQLERIFSPFEQAEDVTRRDKGAGLGLAISRQLVGLMESELCVQSPVAQRGTAGGPGSIFWFEVALPVMDVAAETRSEEPPEREISGYRGPRRTVLVVDDVPSNRAVLVDLLQPLGFDVVEAADGQQAIHLARELRPDLILMDRWMPVLDGFEATRRMRQIPGLKAVPVVAISASVSEEDQAQSWEAGINAFLPKPIHWPNLAALLEEWLGLQWESLAPAGDEEANGPMDESERLVLPPAEEMAILHDLARRGNMHAIQERAAHVERLGEQYVPFARRLRALAKGFEEREILALIEQNMATGQ